SSRRRHTRSKRDWSSDVCSSDLFFLVLAYQVYKRTKSTDLKQLWRNPRNCFKSVVFVRLYTWYARTRKKAVTAKLITMDVKISACGNASAYSSLFSPIIGTLLP